MKDSVLQLNHVFHPLGHYHLWDTQGEPSRNIAGQQTLDDRDEVFIGDKDSGQPDSGCSERNPTRYH